MIDGEATVKAFYMRNSKFVLEPRNKDFEPIVSDEVSIIGKVIANIRLYK
jgi:repressor LexA